MDVAQWMDPDRRPKRIVFFGIDGGRGDYLERFEAPVMRGLAERGVGFRNAIASNGLAETAAGFASMATGLRTSGHGVLTSREWYDRDTGRLIYVYDEETGEMHMDAPTVIQRIKETKPDLRVASISTKDRLAILLPGGSADLVAYSYREHVFHRHAKGSYTGRGVGEEAYKFTERTGRELPSYLQEMSAPRRVNWSGPGFDHPGEDIADTALIDLFIADGALAILERERPDILFVGLVAVNIVGHKWGPESAEIAECFGETDRQIGRVVDYLKSRGELDETLFIVTADHGMSVKPNVIDITKELLERAGDKLVENIAYTFAGSAGGLYLKDPRPEAIEETLAAVRGVPHVLGAWWKDDPEAPWFVKRIAHPNTFDILIVPERDWVIVDPGVEEVNVMAHHGPPFPPDLSIVQIFSGAGIRPAGLVGDLLDMEGRALMTQEEIEGLPEQTDVAHLLLKMYGVEE
ncbi:MAG TPA: hypothetical protein DDZ83_19105 [Nitrospinae bacterium]|nr:hypothetical protein [Nitrospinota bacterium]